MSNIVDLERNISDKKTRTGFFFMLKEIKEIFAGFFSKEMVETEELQFDPEELKNLINLSNTSTLESEIEPEGIGEYEKKKPKIDKRPMSKYKVSDEIEKIQSVPNKSPESESRERG